MKTILTWIGLLLLSGSALHVSAQNQNDISHYLKLKEALVASDYEASQQAALAMESALASSNSAALKKSLQDLSAAKDLAAQREHFEKVSIALYEELKESNAKQGLFKQYCPMAFNGKGAYWLSDQKQIANPYYGDRMLRCGSVQEEL